MASRDEYALKWKQWREEGNSDVERELLIEYLPLVNQVANRLSIGLPSSVDKDDLISFGRMGLMDALQKFDHKRGHKFETYAMWRIKGAMIDGLRQVDWIPRSVRDKAKKVEEAYTALEQKHLRSVSDQEVSEYLGISEEELAQLFQDISVTSLLSLDEPIYDEEEQQSVRQSLIEDEKSDDPEEKLEESDMKNILIGTIDRLPEKERNVVSLCYYEDLSLTEIAEVMGLSTSRISQLHSKAIARLKGSLNRVKKQIM